jgi:hypothetical protein
MLGGRGSIVKPNGACLGKCDKSREDKLDEGIWKSLDRESEPMTVEAAL